MAFTWVLESADALGRSLRGRRTLPLLLAVLLSHPGALWALTYSYDNTTTGTISFAATPCANPLLRTFTVTDSFTVTSVAVGLNVSHTSRGQVRATLVAPGGASLVVVASGADTDDNYDILLSSNTEGALDDNDVDPTGAPLYNRLVSVANINTFYTGNANGTWTLQLCDTTSATNGTFNHARLVLTSAAVATPSCTGKAAYDWGSNGDNPFTSVTVGDITLSQTATTHYGASPAANNFTTRTSTQGGDTGYYLMTMEGSLTGVDSEALGNELALGFSPPVRDLSFSLLDLDRSGSSWEDQAEVIAVGPDGRRVPFTMATGTVNQPAGGATAEGDATSAPADTTGNVLFTFASAVSSINVIYTQGNQPNNGAALQFLGVGDLTFCAYDYGDAPSSYGTTLGGGARHAVGDRTLYLGANPPDGEADGQAGVAAAIDDNTQLSAVDDEDGLLNYALGGSTLFTAISATNQTGGSARLCGYLDGGVNATSGTVTVNGSFERQSGQVGGAGPGGVGLEERCVDVPDGSNGATFYLSWYFPVGAMTTTFLRLRLSDDPNFLSNSSPSPTGAFSGGEVEDFQIVVTPTAATLGAFSAASERVETLLDALEVEGEVRAGLLRRFDPDGDGRAVVVRWDTVQEVGTAGFFLERRDDGGAWRKVGDFLPALIDAPLGGEYWRVDTEARPGGASEYRLVELEVWGTRRLHGPFGVATDRDAGSKALQTRDAATSWGEWRDLAPDFGGRSRRPPVPSRRELEAMLEAQETSRWYAVAKAAASASGPAAVWLRTRGEGLQKISVEALAAALGVEPEKLAARLAEGGQLGLASDKAPWPWLYDAASGFVYFVAQGYATRFTDENAYHATLSGAPASPMRRVTGAGPLRDGAELVFRDTVRLEKDNLFSLWAVRDAADSEYWFWDYLYAGTNHAQISVPLDLPGAASSGEGMLRIWFQGWTDYVPGADHHVRALLGGVELGRIDWDGFHRALLEVPFDQALLAAGPLVLISDLPPGAQSPGQWLDRIEADYWREPKAVGGKLWMRRPRVGVRTVTGFAEPAIRVVEAPGSSQAVAREDVRIAPAPGGGWQVSFRADGVSDYLLSTESAAAAPRLENDLPSSLRSAENSADYLIIAPRELAASAAALADYRRATLGEVAIAWLDDVYDEFAGGRADPEALHAFLAWVRSSWRHVPEYVVLLGKGTVDHRNLQGYGTSLLPVLMTQTPWGLAPADNRYFDVDGDLVADFAGGRIPLTTDAAGLAYVAKVSAAEALAPGVWSSRVVLVADNPDAAGDFHANGAAETARLEALGLRDVVQLFHPRDPVRSRLLASATWEASLLSYDGHGAATQLGDNSERFLLTSDVAALRNTALPVFTAQTCSAGNDAFPGFASLGGTLVLAPAGGAAAAWAASGLSADHEAQLLGSAFVDALLGAGMSVGQAAQAAQRQNAGELSGYLLQIYQVIGDPALRRR